MAYSNIATKKCQFLFNFDIQIPFLMSAMLRGRFVIRKGRSFSFVDVAVIYRMEWLYVFSCRFHRIKVFISGHLMYRWVICCSTVFRWLIFESLLLFNFMPWANFLLGCLLWSSNCVFFLLWFSDKV